MAGILVTGVDPGLVHTGVVTFLFKAGVPRVIVLPHIVDGPHAPRVARYIDLQVARHDVPRGDTYTFIEDYKPRSHYGTDDRMTKAVHDMKANIPNSKVLANHGVKKVVRRDLMDLLECWNFKLTSNHQDLRSAAYIALFGMLKDDRLNSLLTQIVHDHLKGQTWNVLAR